MHKFFIVLFGLQLAYANLLWINYDGHFYLSNTSNNNSVAAADYYNDMNVTGWANLMISTLGQQDDSIQAYGVGYLEGVVTSSLIDDYWSTFITTDIYQFLTDDVVNYILDNYTWMTKMASNNKTSTERSKYWRQVSLVLEQINGLVDGYLSVSNKLTKLDILVLHYSAEIEDIYSKYNDSHKQTKYPNHCTSLVKILDNGLDLFAAHTTWSDYLYMLRIAKTYILNYHSIVSKTVYTTSYPGVIVSFDDYYLTDQGLVIMETSNNIYNQSLYQKLSVNTVPYWIRTTVANRMTDNGLDWCNYFSLYNSGTYNNQWQVIDYKRFATDATNGLLYVLEQIPGEVHFEDLSGLLAKQKYFPSYNVPFFPSIYNTSGYGEMYEKYGDEYSYQSNPRANILRQRQSDVVDLKSLFWLIRYNDYQSDPYSLGDACNSVAARCDLNLVGSMPFGAIDAKMTSSLLAPEGITYIVSGPTNQNQPVFRWDSWPNITHTGQPNIFDFGTTFI